MVPATYPPDSRGSGRARPGRRSGATTSSNDEPPVTRHRITDVEATKARNDDGDPLFVTGDDGADPDDGDRRARVSEVHHLTDEEDLEQLRFRDGPGAAYLKAFVTATDLDSKSVYLLQRPIGECYVPRLVSVFREGDGVDADFCRELRPAGVECDVDAQDVFAVAIRLPFAGDEFSGVGTGMSGDCEHHPTDPLTEGGDAA